MDDEERHDTNRNDFKGVYILVLEGMGLLFFAVSRSSSSRFVGRCRDVEAEFFLDDERPRSRYYVTAIKKCDFLSPFKFMFMFSIIILS